MSFVVFHLDLSGQSATAVAQDFGDDHGLALKHCAELRKRSNVCHVSLSCDMADMVGKAGVDSVEDGHTPDGHVYDWSKAGRAGRMRKSDLVKLIAKN